MIKSTLLLIIAANILIVSKPVYSQDAVKSVKQGNFIYIEGNVQIKEKDSAEWTKVTEDTEFSDGTMIKLENNSFAEVNLDENKSMKINEESMVALNSKTKEKTSLEVFYGSLRAKAKKVPGERMEIRTPVAVAAVRGTEFAVTHEEEAVAELDVFDGEVSMKNITAEGEGDEVIVKKEQWARAGTEMKAEIKGMITEKRELRWQHFGLIKEIFLSKKELKKNKILAIKLDRKYRFMKDMEERIKARAELEILNERNDALEQKIVESKKTIKEIKKSYVKMRMSRAGIRKKLIKKRQKEIPGPTEK